MLSAKELRGFERKESHFCNKPALLDFFILTTELNKPK
jgi:hypothetical protein